MWPRSVIIITLEGNPALNTITIPDAVRELLDGPNYAMDLAELPDDFTGVTLIRAYGGAGGVIAMSNNVNYDVQRDGSVAFNTRRFETPDEQQRPIIIVP